MVVNLDPNTHSIKSGKRNETNVKEECWNDSWNRTATCVIREKKKKNDWYTCKTKYNDIYLIEANSYANLLLKVRDVN